jgi:hypothetical protein
MAISFALLHSEQFKKILIVRLEIKFDLGIYQFIKIVLTNNFSTNFVMSTTFFPLIIASITQLLLLIQLYQFLLVLY